MLVTRPLLFVAIAVNALTITHQPVMTRDTLLATKWRLAGAMFSMPAARRHQDTVTVTVFVELFPALSVQRTVTV